MELRLDRLTKQFGSAIAVDRLSATLTPGVYGLLGANGAGKTTLMRMICDVLKPTSGSVVWNGAPIERLGERYRSVLGYLPQDFGYYPDFSALDFMLYLSALKGLDSKAAKRRSMELLDLVGLKNVAKRKVKTFSGGMKQRLGIAQAVINDPQVLVLDEWLLDRPTSCSGASCWSSWRLATARARRSSARSSARRTGTRSSGRRPCRRHHGLNRPRHRVGRDGRVQHAPEAGGREVAKRRPIWYRWARAAGIPSR